MTNPDAGMHHKTREFLCKMTINHPFRICVILVIAGMALIGSTPVTAVIQTYIGDVVTLSGYSYTGPYVYLFLTGPNLDPDGVAIDNLYRSADQGATQVPVDSNGHWEYKWGTSSTGGKLDAGSYTVWVADGPASRSNLAYVDYSTIDVELSNPYISVNGPTQVAQPGSMDLNSTPDAASVVVNGAFRGTTPLTLSGLDPGVYNVSFSKFGYETLTTPVTVESGSISEVDAALVFPKGSVSVNSTPAGANVTLDGSYAGISPLTIANIVPGNHTLVVSLAGFPQRTLAIQVAGDQTTMADISFVSPTTPATSSAALPAPTRAAGLLPATLGAVLLTVTIVAVKLNAR